MYQEPTHFAPHIPSMYLRYSWDSKFVDSHIPPLPASSSHSVGQGGPWRWSRGHQPGGLWQAAECTNWVSTMQTVGSYHGPLIQNPYLPIQYHMQNRRQHLKPHPSRKQETQGPTLGDHASKLWEPEVWSRTLLHMNMEVERRSFKNYYPPCRALYGLPCSFGGG